MNGIDIIEGLEFSVLVLIEIGTVIFLIFYIIFASVVIKQVKIMTETLEVGFENPIKALAFIHFIFAILALIFAIIVFI